MRLACEAGETIGLLDLLAHERQRGKWHQGEKAYPSETDRRSGETVDDRGRPRAERVGGRHRALPPSRGRCSQSPRRLSPSTESWLS